VVQDEDPAGVTITFSGQVSAPRQRTHGNYSYSGTATGLGEVQAVGVDAENLTSNTATANIQRCARSHLAIA